MDLVVWLTKSELWHDENEDEDEVGMESPSVARIFEVDGVALIAVVAIIAGVIQRMILVTIPSTAHLSIGRVAAFGCKSSTYGQLIGSYTFGSLLASCITGVERKRGPKGDDVDNAGYHRSLEDQAEEYDVLVVWN
ncbi:hypothetical protein C362_05572 [Cryptococcus neoformans Bt1]|nr:hypothetical protein C362_05572 [Cryptococcus neoformans var. grubii Bt1]